MNSCGDRDMRLNVAASYTFPMDSAASGLERGLQVLDLLIEMESDPVRRSDNLSVQQVATELGVHKSTASRLMQTLVASGYAMPNPDGKRGFRLGPALQTHTPASEAQQILAEHAHPFLERLVELTGECAHAAVASGSSVLVIDDVETGHQLRVVAGKGRRVPVHCTSAGKVLSAFGLVPAPDELSPRTPNTITAAEDFKSHLAEVRAARFAIDDEENYLGVRCISAPVFDGQGGRAIGCIGVDGPTIRMSDVEIEQMARTVVSIASQLSDAIGEALPAVLLGA